MKALLIARKTLIELWREPLLLGLIIGLPLLFLIITALGYGYPLLATYPIRIALRSSQTQAVSLIQEIDSCKYFNGKPCFSIIKVEQPSDAEAALMARTASALLIIDSLHPLQVEIRGDALNMNFIRASTLLEEKIRRWSAVESQRVESLKIVERYVQDEGPLTGFDQYTPGMIVFAILLLIPQSAMLVGKEIRTRTLKRLRLTRSNAFDIVAGYTLAQMVVSIIVIALSISTAMLLGFHNRGSFFLAMITGLILSFSAIGLGLLTACFIKDDSQAINIGSVVTMLQVFISGAFFPMPPVIIGYLAGHPVSPFDIIPATHGMIALQQVISYGAGFKDVSYRLYACFSLSLFFFLIGVLIFHNRQIKASY